MKLIEARDIIRTYRKKHTSFKEIAEALCITEQAIRKRIKNGTELREDECYALASKFRMSWKYFFSIDKIPTYAKIEYYKHPTLKLYEHPDIPFYVLDMNVAYKYNSSFEPKNFKIVSMIGNVLNGALLWAKDKDILLLDTKATDLKNGGYFCYTCTEDYINFAWIKKSADGTHFKFLNPEEEVVKSEKYLKEVKFNIVGRIIKNTFRYY